MDSAYVFEKGGEYRGKIEKNENFSKNSLVKGLIDGPVNFVRHENDFLISEKIDEGDENYFWAVVETLRERGFLLYVLDGERREIAELLTKAPLEKGERKEFFDSLLSVPEESLKKLKSGIEKDLKETE